MATVKNMDIAGLVSRANIFRDEILSAQSVNQASGTSVVDLARAQSYMTALEAFKADRMSKPPLDLPTSHDLMISVVVPEDIGDIENLDIQHLIRLIDSMIMELVGCQSADRRTGLISHDDKRFDEIMLSIDEYLTNYVGGAAMPLDMPSTVQS